MAVESAAEAVEEKKVGMIGTVRSNLESRGYTIEEDISSGAHNSVYVISKEGAKRTLKHPSARGILLPFIKAIFSDNDFYIPFRQRVIHTRAEKNALEMVRGVDGIAQLVDSFDFIVPWHVHLRAWPVWLVGLINYSLMCPFTATALIKDYIEGRHLGEGEKIKGSENQKVLANAVEALHKEGIVGLDLVPRRYEGYAHKPSGNIVVTKTGKPYLVDLGTAMKYDLYNYDGSNAKSNDLRDLEMLTS